LSLLDSLPPKRIYDLAEPLNEQTPRSPTHPPFSLALLRRHGDSVSSDGMSSSADVMHLGGHTGTHVDALAHVSVYGRLHGGADAGDAMRGGRFRTHGVDTIAPFFGRGVLLDVPRALGVDALAPGQRITGSDLEAVATVERVAIGEGDAVLVRTGRPLGRFADMDSTEAVEAGVPGLDESAARWLAGKRVVVTGSDTIAYEWLAPGAGFSHLPVHVILLYESAIHIIEVMNLEELAADTVHEFLFVAAPLKISGGTGSPIRPLAVVG